MTTAKLLYLIKSFSLMVLKVECRGPQGYTKYESMISVNY